MSSWDAAQPPSQEEDRPSRYGGRGGGRSSGECSLVTVLLDTLRLLNVCLEAGMSWRVGLYSGIASLLFPALLSPREQVFLYDSWKYALFLSELLSRKSICPGRVYSYGLKERVEAVAWVGWRRCLVGSAGSLGGILWDISSV